MNKYIFYVLLALFPLHPQYAYAEMPLDSVYLSGTLNKIGLILCHGRGKHPTWKVVDPLRKGINSKLGYHTLSIQMPNENKYWKDYAEDFPVAYKRIQAATDFLKKKKGVTKVFLMGHSMGARMASSYVAENQNHGLSGLIVAGCRNNGGKPLSCIENLESINIPVLDIWGGDNNKDSNSASYREALRSKSYTQAEITGANHKFEDYDDELVTTVSLWLEKQ